MKFMRNTAMSLALSTAMLAMPAMADSGEIAAAVEADFSRGFFVLIGQSRKNNRTTELWVLQDGFVPGSKYLLLARSAEIEGVIEEFTVLQSRCPQSWLRETKNLDIWLTRYCSINTQDEMLHFAKRMLREPALGTLKLVPNEEGPESQAPDPSETHSSE